MMKEYLSRKGVEFTERDVTSEPAAMGELEKLGFLSTPVTVINGEVIVGFNRKRLDELLS